MCLISVPGVPEHLEPFIQPESVVQALAFRPNSMDEGELAEFPEYTRGQQLYLGLRNTVIAMWVMDCKVFTIEVTLVWVVFRLVADRPLKVL